MGVVALQINALFLHIAVRAFVFRCMIFDLVFGLVFGLLTLARRRR
jgi:hypothetical protein